MILRNRHALLLPALALVLPIGAAAEKSAPSIALQSSFRIGDAGVPCTAQSRSDDARAKGMFDRAYRIVCQDAAAPVGFVHALRGSAAGVVPDDGLTCAEAAPAEVAGLAGVMRRACSAPSGLAYVHYAVRARGVSYSAQGLAGYDPAIRLGLASVVLDRRVPGVVEVATNMAGDANAFARIQAGNLDPEDALAQGYARNNAGSFAEAAEYFETLAMRGRDANSGFRRTGEYLVNLAMQQSNLGNSGQAEYLFAEAGKSIDRSDPLALRLQRNLNAMHWLNRQDPAQVVAVLDAPLALTGEDAEAAERLGQGFIDMPVAQRLNTDRGTIGGIPGISTRLSTAERATLLDSQAQFLRGAALVQLGRDAEARTAMNRSIAQLNGVRGGNIASMNWLRASAGTNLALLDERAGRTDSARRLLEGAVAVYARDFPDSAALMSARGRLAALQGRAGDSTAAIATYRALVAAAAGTTGSGVALRGQLRPYFDLLTTDATRPGSAAADMFVASQALVRPGVAQTQAVFARELSGGSDDAARLFRQSLNIGRELVRLDSEIAGLADVVQPDEATKAALTARQESRAALAKSQTETLAQLGQYPKFRAFNANAFSLADLQAKLRDGEGYYKLSVVGDAAYAVYATGSEARAFKLAAPASEIERLVNTIRASIVRREGGRMVTEPFDVVAARKLYVILFDPVGGDVARSKHLIFEGDGAMLRLPVNLLVTDQATADSYAKRIANPAADPFDLRRIKWLGRDHVVSTATSAQAFVQVRDIAASKARRNYLGLGENAPAPPATATAARDYCDWPLTAWSKPIAPTELNLAAATLSGGGGNAVMTGAPFSDDAVKARGDLADYRVIHFATHGLVTAPKQECPARPALMTSFGGSGSDGLLSFREIFDLRLDADTIILSACDTAGAASVDASREAGVATGGDFALDGLVRAFVGAGARSVVASHWPVPDTYGATEKLIGGMVSGGYRTGIGEAMRASQLKLMESADTSHPYYWSGFAIVGDAAKPIVGG